MNRFRRLRITPAIRDLVRETVVTSNDFIMPFFVLPGKKKSNAIESMPGINRFSVDILIKEVEAFIKLGGKAGLFFGIPQQKDTKASEVYSEKGTVQTAIRLIKKSFPDFVVITDVCMCSYTSHGHCGILKDGYVDNDQTIKLLAKAAVSHAQAGADIVAPSDMMDFRVSSIRGDLDKSGFINTSIMSYAVKYSSAFYGPFRDAADSTPESGDRKNYQMDPANKREALKEAKQDVVEGADFIMVKPALAYLDIVSLLKEKLDLPIVAYNVSGEYSMVKAAAQKKWINEKDIVLEMMVSMKRAGADLIISYHAKDVLEWIK